MSKYHANRTTVDGLEFASKREADRYQDLCLLANAEGAGRIKDLVCQMRFPLRAGPNQVTVAWYVADFVYAELQDDGDWLQVIEDCKGVRTPVYKLKAKMMLACHGITIRET